jgi:hypothetical protein
MADEVSQELEKQEKPEISSPAENKPGKPEKRKRQLRTREDHNQIYEWLINAQLSGEIDATAARAINTTMEGAVYLNAKLPMEVIKLKIMADRLKIPFPDNLLPK